MFLTKALVPLIGGWSQATKISTLALAYQIMILENLFG
jgi:hypothetical protein